MRVECSDCLSVYESDDTENEERAACPYCEAESKRTTAREFRVVPLRDRVRTSPFGLESGRSSPADGLDSRPPVAPTRVSIICPPASRALDAPPYHGAETPAYVRVAERAREPERAASVPSPSAVEPATDDTEARRVGRDDGEGDDARELPGIDPPAGSLVEHRRPVYDWALTSLPENRVPRDTERPIVRSDRSPEAEPETRRRPRTAMWIPFVLGAAGAAFLVRGWSPAPPAREESKPSMPPSLASHLSAFDQGISVGDMEQALTALDRASRIAVREPAVLLARARLAVERADAEWLIRRATPGAPADGASYEDFVRSAGEARSAAEEALRAMPQSDDARRTLVNALRIFGEIDRARELAAGLRDQTSAESAYALVALDMVAPDVAPERSAARLRQNPWVGGLPGKARAALVYALVRAGDIEGADGELAKLALLARPHPALAALRAFVDVSRPPPKPAPTPKHDKHSSTKLCPEDFKARQLDAPSVLREAVNARCRGDLEGARKLYSSIVDLNPRDSEALSGMGDLARLEDSWDAARNFYAEALRANPSFMPAALGAAYVEWDLGNLAVAQRKYREILETFPNGHYPPRVRERAAPEARGPKGSG